MEAVEVLEEKDAVEEGEELKAEEGEEKKEEGKEAKEAEEAEEIEKVEDAEDGEEVEDTEDGEAKAEVVEGGISVKKFRHSTEADRVGQTTSQKPAGTELEQNEVLEQRSDSNSLKTTFPEVVRACTDIVLETPARQLS